MEALTKTIAQALVDLPDEVSVTAIESNHTAILRLRVGPGDAGKIIGKQGRTAKAFRTIINAVAAKEKRRVILEILDDAASPAVMASEAASVSIRRRMASPAPDCQADTPAGRVTGNWGLHAE